MKNMNNVEELKKYKYSGKIQLRYEEFDTFHHLNNVAYLSCFQHVRSMYVFSFMPNHYWEEFPMVIVSSTINYYVEVPISIREVEVFVRVSAVGKKSVTIDHMMVTKNKKTEEYVIHSWCQTVLVAIDKASRRAIEITEEYRKIFESHSSN